MNECMHTACDNERLLFESYCQSHLLPERASQDALPIFKDTPDTQPPVKSEDDLRAQLTDHMRALVGYTASSQGSIDYGDFLVDQIVEKAGKRNEATITRFEVIDHAAGGEGRAYVKRDVSIELSYQDDGRTLKVFVGDRQAGDD